MNTSEVKLIAERLSILAQQKPPTEFGRETMIRAAEELLSLAGMFSKAIVFKITEGRLPITVESRGGDAWVVCDPGFVLNRAGEFELEPLPSNRDDEFIARTRFTFKEAWERAEKVAKERKV